MKQPVIPAAHPLGELLAKKLFGISSVPPKEMDKMVYRAITEAVKWHEEAILDPHAVLREKAKKILESRGFNPQRLREYSWPSLDGSTCPDGVGGRKFTEQQVIAFVDPETLASVVFRGGQESFVRNFNQVGPW